MPRADEQILRAVRRILWDTWDPIGVHQHAAASTEYDSYAPVIVGMLLHECTPHDLQSHLARLETESMGLSPRSNGTRDATIAALLNLQFRDETFT